MKLGEKRVEVEGGGEGMDGIKPYLYAFMSFSNNRKRGTIFPMETSFHFSLKKQPRHRQEAPLGIMCI